MEPGEGRNVVRGQGGIGSPEVSSGGSTESPAVSAEDENKVLRARVASLLNSAVLAQNTAELARRDRDSNRQEYALQSMYAENRMAQLQAEITQLGVVVGDMESSLQRLVQLVEVRGTQFGELSELAKPRVGPAVHLPKELGNKGIREIAWVRQSLANAQSGLDLYLDSYDCTFNCVKRKSVEEKEWHRASWIVIVDWDSKNFWPCRIERVNALDVGIPNDILLAHPIFDRKTVSQNASIGHVIQRLKCVPMNVSSVESVADVVVTRVWAKMESYLLVCWNVEANPLYPWSNYSWIPKAEVRGAFECYEKVWGSSCARFGRGPCSEFCHGVRKVRASRGKAGQFAADCLVAHNVINTQLILQ
ncbi:hypothetical protein FVE85_2437 [Porphyridium purpureum]|uniref:Uncharacterized protein n=1 Tax=Porphyridium purpureum TaxID=35688 RepID=A0A5J4YK88_PORPP|nr:hypothetical protein FVE85_1205 [Porphyridium purpureum]KAA8491422.1 hypothetical protein FVE85_2437 [Porphyridium purpureum]|eukprot:POR3443..scf244_28